MGGWEISIKRRGNAFPDPINLNSSHCSSIVGYLKHNNANARTIKEPEGPRHSSLFC